MKTTASTIIVTILILSVSAAAGNTFNTPVSEILEHGKALGLTESQVKKLSIIEDSAAHRMSDAKLQADIRLAEIEKFTSNWTNMNGVAVRGLLKEYYEFLSQYKKAELNAIIQARAILEYKQLTKYQQLVSIESLILDMENQLALK